MNKLSALASLASLALLGCAVDVDENVGETTQAMTSENRLSMNRLSMNRLSMNRLSMNRLSMNRLSMNRLSMNRLSMNGLADTDEGRELLTYVARCALPADLSLTVVDDAGAELYTFPGQIGLAPEWETEALTPSAQRWVSACLLAHVNAFGISVPISLRGPHPALTSFGKELVEFPVQEAAFYGNLFEDVDGDGQGDIQLYGCQGQLVPSQVDNEYLKLRICADSPTSCGFTVIGDCDRRNFAPTWACSATAETYYRGCHSEGATWLKGKAEFPATALPFDEVITVYLRSTTTRTTTSKAGAL